MKAFIIVFAAQLLSTVWTAPLGRQSRLLSLHFVLANHTLYVLQPVMSVTTLF